MLDMERAVEEYARYLDERVAPIDVLEIVEQPVIIDPDRQGRTLSPTRRFVLGRPWAVAATAAAVALLVVGGILVLLATDVSNPPASDPFAPLEEDGDPTDLGPPAFQGLIRVESPEPLDQNRESMEEMLGLRITAATEADLELFFEVDYRPGPGGGMRVRFSDPSSGVERAGETANFVVYDGDRMGDYLAFGDIFTISNPDSFQSVLGALWWSTWDGICGGDEIEVPVEETVAGRSVHYTRCERLRGDLDVWVDRESSLVLKAEQREAGVGSIPRWGGIQVPGSGFSFVEVGFDPIYLGDEFVLRAPDGADVEIDREREPSHPDPREHSQVGKAAPAIAGDLLDGGSFDLATLRGQRVAVLVWASWCLPCIDQLEAFQAYVDDYSPPFEVVTVIYVDDAEPARTIVDRGPITLPVVDGSELGRGYFEALDISGFPAVIFIDESGTVVALQVGMDPVADLFELVGWAP